jgi:hypothetical protein
LKTENDLNRQLSKEFKKRRGLHALKASDKISVGIPDFLLWFKGNAAGLETKFIKEWPSDRAKLLKHAFSGAQQTWLESLEISGSHGKGGVYVHCEKLLYIVDYNEIPEGGNWTTRDFRENHFPYYSKQEWHSSMVEHILGVMG